MRTQERSVSLPGWRAVQGGWSRIRRVFAAAPLPVKILVLALLIFLSPISLSIVLVAALAYAPYAVWAAHRSVIASLAVALWGVAVVFLLAKAPGGLPPLALLALPFLAIPAAHLGSLGRGFAPCRTVAWTLVFALPPGALAWHFLPHAFKLTGPALAWLIALVVLGWRLAKSLQDGRQYGRQQIRGGALAAPPWPPPGASGGGRRPGVPRPGSQAGPGRGGRLPAGRVAVAAESGRPGYPGEGQRGPQADPGAGRAVPEQPDITIDEAMAELDGMIGLTAVKDQIRSIAASIEAARRRALAGHAAEKPMQHFVFLGPPGTGKTAVARIVARIFYAFGLLDTPAVVEAHRANLIGEYLGATAIKTNELVDSALGGVLFIDEAYSLVNEGDGQGDRFGNEAVQALLKRAEDDRDNLVIILAGYERQME
jgi:hypothetical protein